MRNLKKKFVNKFSFFERGKKNKHSKLTTEEKDSTSEATKEINESVNSLATSQASSDYMQIEKMSVSPYDSQVNIILSPDLTYHSDILAKKWNSNHEENQCHLVSLQDFLNKKTRFTELNKKSKLLRIYIVAHCWIASDVLYNYGGPGPAQIDFNTIADALSHYLGDQQAHVRLFSCCAGKGKKEDESDSFAAKLHLALTNVVKRDVPIIANNTIPYAKDNPPRKISFDVNELRKRMDIPVSKVFSMPGLYEFDKYYIHHQKNSKIVYTMDCYNNQLRLNADSEQWKVNYLENDIDTYQQDLLDYYHSLTTNQINDNQNFMLEEDDYDFYGMDDAEDYINEVQTGYRL